MKLWQASSFSPMGPVFLICTWLGLEAVGLICFRTIQDHTFGFCFGSSMFSFSSTFQWFWHQSWPTNITNSAGHLHFLWATDRHLYTVRRLATPPWSTRWPKKCPEKWPGHEKRWKKSSYLQEEEQFKNRKGSFHIQYKGYNRHSNSCINHGNYSHQQEP